FGGRMASVIRSRMVGTIALSITTFGPAASLGAAQASADLVVRNGDIVTVDAAFSHASAVAIRDGVFKAVGSDVDVQKWIGTNTRVIDAAHAIVIPGLLESHVH